MGDPFNQVQTNENNIFEAAKQRNAGQQGGTPMPQGFQQRPPETGTAKPSNQVPGHIVYGDDPGSQDSATSGAAREGASPLDRYSQIDDNGSNGDAAKKSQDSQSKDAERQEDKDFFDSLQMSTLQERISKSDFTKSLDREKVEAALGGDVESFMAVMNSAMQSAVASATFGGAKLAGVGTAQRMERFQRDLPNQLREREISGAWDNEKESILSHPAVKPLRAATVEMLKKQHPNASAQELREHTEGYFQALFQAQNLGQQRQQQEDPANQEFDMSSIFNDL